MIENLKIKDDIKIMAHLVLIAKISGISAEDIKKKMLYNGVSAKIVEQALGLNKNVVSKITKDKDPELVKEFTKTTINLMDVLLAAKDEELDADDVAALKEMIGFSTAKMN